MNNASQILHQQIIQNNTEITALRAEVERLRSAHTNLQHDIQQTLGRALGYPWFKNDQKNFPGSTEADGVCVGDHVAESLADEAADKIAALRAENEKLRAALHEAADELDAYYRAEYPGDHPYSKRKLADAMRDNPARAAITQEKPND